MITRLAASALAILALASTSMPATAQSEEEVYDSIESIHGNADGFFEVLSLLQDAVMFGDPVTFGQYAFFPLAVNVGGESYEVLQPDDLTADFDNIFTPEVQQAVLEQDPADLVVTSEGVGVGNGAVWITNVCLDDACEETQWGIISVYP
ncbi:hypothetical protein SAMN06295905_1861 [Devosia lucknowensis]|uniref:Uncharacterized protein n=1 Tax=Devosia lucknowensis TaxID=1096929 RepID=A0A1Y6F621_9HYPH|nr:hypothetical protein [Devosia lucknowensis]SMQ70274.1 hypothetical protein SAMN06295905_1861 [Devosia lucknowensis]